MREEEVHTKRNLKKKKRCILVMFTISSYWSIGYLITNLNTRLYTHTNAHSIVLSTYQFFFCSFFFQRFSLNHSFCLLLFLTHSPSVLLGSSLIRSVLRACSLSLSFSFHHWAIDIGKKERVACPFFSFISKTKQRKSNVKRKKKRTNKQKKNNKPITYFDKDNETHKRIREQKSTRNSYVHVCLLCVCVCVRVSAYKGTRNGVIESHTRYENVNREWKTEKLYARQLGYMLPRIHDHVIWIG